MSKEKTIKETYFDALFWAMSPQSKGNNYHLSRAEATLLLKLIHYDRKNSVIRYSNKTIGLHTFLEESHVEKLIPSIRKKGFISCIDFVTHNTTGEKIRRRIININWDFIKSVLALVPKDSTDDVETELESDMVESMAAQSKDQNGNKEKNEIESNQPPEKKEPKAKKKIPVQFAEVNELKETTTVEVNQEPVSQAIESTAYEIKRTDESETNETPIIRYEDEVSTNLHFYNELIKKIEVGEKLNFAPVHVVYVNGEINSDEMVRIENYEKVFIKSKLKRLNPELSF